MAKYLNQKFFSFFLFKMNHSTTIQTRTRDILMLISVEFFDFLITDTNDSQCKATITLVKTIEYQTIQQYSRE